MTEHPIEQRMRASVIAFPAKKVNEGKFAVICMNKIRFRVGL